MIDLATAREQLRSHNLGDLFVDVLGWCAPHTVVEAITPLNQRCMPIAQRDRQVGLQTVWQVILAENTCFTSTLRSQLYTAICAHEKVLNPLPELASKNLPLLIIVAAEKTRSLWCSSLYESALYVVSQPMAVWDYRLRRLATGGGLFLAYEPKQESSNRFERLLTQLSESVNGIEDITHKRTYAALTLRRLMLIQQIQQKGWLDGDTWYLQSRFSTFLQRGERFFFKTCLQPLFQSLSLPEIERPIALEPKVGKVPYIGGLFSTHQLEATYSSISIEDAALEEGLGWLSEQASTNELNPWLDGAIGHWLARSVGGTSLGVTLSREVGDRALDILIQQRLDQTPTSTFYKTSAQATELYAQNSKAQTLNDQLFNADTHLCRQLIQEILPALRVLDPACGSGCLLVTFHRRLTEIFSILTGYVQQNQDAQLKIWRSGLVEMPEGTHNSRYTQNFVQTIQQRILNNVLYGVDCSDDAVESARLYLAMHLVETAVDPAEIEPLIDLDFNLISGNALIGYITVDEERFDQINRAGAETAFQGDLLQPLVADSYQMVLREKNIALEHYQSRTAMLADVHNVPGYARASLLKEEILVLDQKAQNKLDKLLLNYMSQQLGIRYRSTQLADITRYRLLTQQDIESLHPFHFGYHFNTIIKHGGFDLVACNPPVGPLRPTVAKFIQQFPTLTQRENISEKTFRTSKPALSRANSEVAATWMSYRDRYAYAADYFQRSELYAYQQSDIGRKTRSQLAQERLFVERCLRLLNSDGLGVVLVPTDSFKDPKAASLYRRLQASKWFGEFEYGAGTSKKLVIVWSKDR